MSNAARSTREARLLGDLEREVDREAVGVVQEERLGAGERRAAGILRLRERRVEDRRARRERAEERLLLGVARTREARVVVSTTG